MRYKRALTRREVLRLGGVATGSLTLGLLMKGQAQSKTLNTIALPPDWANYG